MSEEEMPKVAKKTGKPRKSVPREDDTLEDVGTGDVPTQMEGYNAGSRRFGSASAVSRSEGCITGNGFVHGESKIEVEECIQEVEDHGYSDWR